MGMHLLQLLNKMLKKNRLGAIEISFTWIFAIIAGIAIIFGALYLSSKVIQSGQEGVSAKTGKEIGVLLNPLETSFESAQTTSITIPSETRISNKCYETGTFGEQFIQLNQKSFNKWVKTDTNVRFDNKYLFSKEEVEGKTFYIFSKPFNFPFKVTDLFYVTSGKDNYCFNGAPEEVNEEIFRLNQTNLFIENCPEGSIKVCFGKSNCEVNVDFGKNYVKKGQDIMYFSGLGEDFTSLMYAAIFSDKSVYECQINRLLMRVKELSKIYLNKEQIIAEKGCDTNLGEDLTKLSDMENLKGSKELENLKEIIDTIEEKNNARGCLLW